MLLKKWGLAGRVIEPSVLVAQLIGTKSLSIIEIHGEGAVL